MLDLYDEAGADAEVDRILAKRKRNKEKIMSVIYRDQSGIIVEVMEAKPVDREQLEKRVGFLRQELESAEKTLASYDEIDKQNNQPAPAEAPTTAAVPPSEKPVQDPPVAPTTPAPQPAPVDAVTPPQVQPQPTVAVADTELKPQPIVMG